MPELSNRSAPKLVNRGAAGLLSKAKVDAEASAKAVKTTADILATAPKDRFLPELQTLTVPIGLPIFDPDNARIHPERNMEAIRLSLAMYGQRTPIVVNKRNKHVLKGNGTLQAARELGWTKIAKVWTDDDEVTAAGYGLADNRSAELAKWDFEVVAKLDRLIQESNLVQVGWSLDELEVLRAADWTPPAVSDEEFTPTAETKLRDLTEEQLVIINQVVGMIQQREGLDPEAAAKFGLTWGECLKIACTEWLEIQDARAAEENHRTKRTLGPRG